jgi:hypothetical protein
MKPGRFIQYKKNGSVLWTPLLCWLVALAGVAAFLLGNGVGYFADAHTDTAGDAEPNLAIVGAGMLFTLAIWYAVDGAAYRRHRDAPFPKIVQRSANPAIASRSTRQRMSCHRREFLMYSSRRRRTNLGTQLRTARKIAEMLDRVPMEPEPGATVRQCRRSAMLTVARCIGVVLAFGVVVSFAIGELG